MKAITLWQPWASLIALGVKTIETRSWPAPKALIGGRIAIHAAKRQPVEVGTRRLCSGGTAMWDYAHPHSDPVDLPLGAVVATATLADCVPITACTDETHHICLSGSGDLYEHWPLTGRHVDDTEAGRNDQLPYGHFAPGRWAWMLTDIEALPDPIPATGRQGVWTWAPPAPSLSRSYFPSCTATAPSPVAVQHPAADTPTMSQVVHGIVTARREEET